MPFKNDTLYRRYIPEEKRLRTKMDEAIETPTHGSYGSLLFDARWRSKREEILMRDAHACVICSGEENLQVHHRQYQFVLKENAFRKPWDYADHLLITLCEACHKRGHNKYKVPTIKI